VYRSDHSRYSLGILPQRRRCIHFYCTLRPYIRLPCLSRRAISQDIHLGHCHVRSLANGSIHLPDHQHRDPDKLGQLRRMVRSDIGSAAMDQYVTSPLGHLYAIFARVSTILIVWQMHLSTYVLDVLDQPLTYNLHRWPRAGWFGTSRDTPKSSASLLGTSQVYLLSWILCKPPPSCNSKVKAEPCIALSSSRFMVRHRHRETTLPVARS
jgi:hypothetical protein